ncbi:hypothetical protein Tco_0221097 [Tanacetum coccineum]
MGPDSLISKGLPAYGFSELHQLDTFYNALNSNDQDSLNSAAGGNFLDKMPRECLKIIESKSKVRQSRSKAIVSKVSTSSSTPAVSSDVAELKDMVRELILDKKKPKLQLPLLLRRYEQKGHKKSSVKNDDLLASKIYRYFSDSPFRAKFRRRFLHMPKFAPMFRKLLNDKDIDGLRLTRHRVLNLGKTFLKDVTCLNDVSRGMEHNDPLDNDDNPKYLEVLKVAIPFYFGSYDRFSLYIFSLPSEEVDSFYMEGSMHFLNTMIQYQRGVVGFYDLREVLFFLEECYSVIK